MADVMDADPRYLSALVRMLSLNDVNANYGQGGGDAGPFNMTAAGAQSSIPGQYDAQRVYGGAEIPLGENASINPGIFAMNEQTGPQKFQSVSPGASLNVGPIGAMIAKNYNAASGPDYSEKSRPISFGGTASIPMGNAEMTYRGIKTGNDPMQHMIGVSAPFLGGDLAMGANANRLNRPDGAYLRWRAQF